MVLYWTINQKKPWELPPLDDNMASWRNFFANLPLTLKPPTSNRQKAGQHGMATENGR